MLVLRAKTARGSLLEASCVSDRQGHFKRPDFLGRMTCHKATLKSSQCKTCERGMEFPVPGEAELSFPL